MILVGLLTEQQKDELLGQLYSTDSYFNPIQDNNGNWIISIEEIQQNTNKQLNFINNLPLIEYNPIQIDLI